MKNIAIAALVILLLLAGIGFLIFGLVQSVGNDDNDGDNKTETSDNSGNDDSEDKDDEGSVNGDAVNDSDNGDNDDNSPGNSDKSGSTGNSGMSSANAGRFPRTNDSYRRGNDYKFGDIKGNRYTVKSGDTLWQIAEARYGSGYAWTEINKANGKFRNLPNGKPVLIRTGQTIILPEL